MSWDEYEFDEKIRSDYEHQDAEEEKENEILDRKKHELLNDEDFMSHAKDRLWEDEDFLEQIKRDLTDNSNYFHSAVDSKYSKIEIFRDKKKHILLKGTYRISSEGVDIIWLKRDHPNSEIRIVNYEGNISYIEIVDKHHIERPE
jgi:hypothetical protein